MKYVSTTESSKKWNIFARRIGTLCAEGQIPDVQRAGNMWLIPENAEKPADARIKSGKYIKILSSKRRQVYDSGRKSKTVN